MEAPSNRMMARPRRAAGTRYLHRDGVFRDQPECEREREREPESVRQARRRPADPPAAPETEET